MTYPEKTIAAVNTLYLLCSLSVSEKQQGR